MGVGMFCYFSLETIFASSSSHKTTKLYFISSNLIVDYKMPLNGQALLLMMMMTGKGGRVFIISDDLSDDAWLTLFLLLLLVYLRFPSFPCLPCVMQHRWWFIILCDFPSLSSSSSAFISAPMRLGNHDEWIRRVHGFQHLPNLEVAVHLSDWRHSFAVS